jgi:hypothetical protein
LMPVRASETIGAPRGNLMSNFANLERLVTSCEIRRRWVVLVLYLSCTQHGIKVKFVGVDCATTPSVKFIYMCVYAQTRKRELC